MKPAPLQIARYFVTDCHVTASKQFKAGEKVALDFDQLEIQNGWKSVDTDRQWEVSLRVKFQPGPEVNTPYFFTLEVVGFFSVAPNYPEEKIERLVRTNGSSMLYGVVREVVREMTGRGPHAQMLLPSVSFVPPKSPVHEPVEAVKTSE